MQESLLFAAKDHISIQYCAGENLNQNLDDIINKIINICNNSSLQNPSRIFVSDLFGLYFSFVLNHATDIRLITRFIFHLKHAVRKSYTSIIITLHKPMISKKLYTNIVHIVDNLIAFEEFAGRNSSIPAQFTEFSGYLRPVKIQQMGSLVSHRPSQLVYGLKRDRRKLHIEPLHLPPEDIRTPAREDIKHSMGESSLRSSSGSLCASNSTSYDF